MIPALFHSICVFAVSFSGCAFVCSLTDLSRLLSFSSLRLPFLGAHLKIIDGDTNETVERFPVTLIHQPTAFNHSNHIYDNILIFTVQHPEESQGKKNEEELALKSDKQTRRTCSNSMMKSTKSGSVSGLDLRLLPHLYFAKSHSFGAEF